MDDLPADLAALCAPARVEVRFEWARPPFRAIWTWNGQTRSVARWGPFAAKRRACELFGHRIDAAIDQWFEDQRTARRQAARQRDLDAILGRNARG